MTEKFTAFDAAQVLENDEMIAVFVNEAFKTGDAAHISRALGIAARAKRMAKVAQDSGLNREHNTAQSAGFNASYRLAIERATAPIVSCLTLG